MNIDHAAAVAAARTWANQMLEWPKCSLTQRLMVLRILRDSDAGLFAGEQYAALVKLSGEWRERKVDRSESRESFTWMIEQLENCLGIVRMP